MIVDANKLIRFQPEPADVVLMRLGDVLNEDRVRGLAGGLEEFERRYPSRDGQVSNGNASDSGRLVGPRLRDGQGNSVRQVQSAVRMQVLGLWRGDIQVARCVEVADSARLREVRE